MQRAGAGFSPHAGALIYAEETDALPRPLRASQAAAARIRAGPRRSSSTLPDDTGEGMSGRRGTTCWRPSAHRQHEAPRPRGGCRTCGARLKKRRRPVAIQRPMGRRDHASATGNAHRARARAHQAMTGMMRLWLTGPLLFVCVLSGYLFSFTVDQPAHNGDWYIRYQVTCAIVEHNSFAITPYQVDNRTGLGLRGRTYAQYTLGQTTAMIPLYLLGRRLAGLAHTDCAAPVAPPIVLLTCKLLGPLLGALLAMLCYATARLLAYRRRVALALTALLAFGTALWPDVHSNLEHTMESLFLLAAAYAALRYTAVSAVGLRRSGEGRLWLVVMGLAAGLVFVTRVAGVIALPLLAVYLLLLHRRQRPRAWRRPLAHDLALFGLGVLPAVVVNATYDALRFGSPLLTNPPTKPDHSLGFPPWLGLPDLLVSPGKGLLWYTPAVLLLVLATRPFWRRCPLPATLFALLCGGYLLFYSNVTYWHGDPAWGPRYLYATLPYLILPLGEVFGRWRTYRFPLRGLLVGVLAASLLVQFSAVTVSYWRSFHDVFATYPDQIDHYSWGFNLNYFWTPEQSPLLLALQGVTDNARLVVDHVPLVRHTASVHLGSANESCVFPVYHQATLCLTDVDALRDRASFNTYVVWWLHPHMYPWWSPGMVIALAVALLGLFLCSGAALLRLFWDSGLTPRSVTSRKRRAFGRGVAPGEQRRRGQPAVGSGNAIRERMTTRALSSVAASAVARGATGAPGASDDARGDSGLGPLAMAALGSLLVYGCLATAGALSAPRHVASLTRGVVAGRIVVDGDIAYRVLGIARSHSVVDTLYPPAEEACAPAGGRDASCAYVVVRVWLRNLSSRRQHGINRANFMLTAAAGSTTYPWPCWVPVPIGGHDRLSRPSVGRDAPDLQGAGTRQPSCPLLHTRSFVDPAVVMAAVYHLSPAWYPIPPRVAVQRVLVYVAPIALRHVVLLGPGIALTHLDLPPRSVAWLSRPGT